jgi:hypothetical protein
MAARPARSKSIAEILTDVASSGHSRSRVFDDWLEAVDLAIQQAPAHLLSLATTGQLAQDRGAVKEAFDRLHREYRPAEMERFAEAFGVLWSSALEGWDDQLGRAFTELELGGPGQCFTPWPVAVMMAQMQCPDVEAELRARLARDPFEPWTVSDPAVGSGVMLLATASVLPPWAIEYGLVQFYGMDIDRRCVRMTAINCRLYALNAPPRPEAARAFLAEHAACTSTDLEVLPDGDDPDAGDGCAAAVGADRGPDDGAGPEGPGARDLAAPVRAAQLRLWEVPT